MPGMPPKGQIYRARPYRRWCTFWRIGSRGHSCILYGFFGTALVIQLAGVLAVPHIKELSWVEGTLTNGTKVPLNPDTNTGIAAQLRVGWLGTSLFHCDRISPQTCLAGSCLHDVSTLTSTCTLPSFPMTLSKLNIIIEENV